MFLWSEYKGLTKGQMDLGMIKQPRDWKAVRKRKRARKPKRPKSACFVYALSADDGAVMYVGQTRCSLETRLKWHLVRAKNGLSDVQLWMRQRTADGETIRIHMLDANAIWDVTECVWIARLRENGVPLTNMTDGGRSGPQLRRRGYNQTTLDNHSA